VLVYGGGVNLLSTGGKGSPKGTGRVWRRAKQEKERGEWPKEEGKKCHRLRKSEPFEGEVDCIGGSRVASKTKGVSYITKKRKETQPLQAYQDGN